MPMQPPWSYEQGQSLVDRNLISPQTFQSAYPTAPAAQEPAPQPAAPAPEAPAKDPNDDGFGDFLSNSKARKEEARRLRAEQDKVEAADEAVRLREKIQAHTTDLLDSGHSEEETRGIVGPDLLRLKHLEQKVAGDKPTAQPAAMKTEEKPPVVLASDRQPASDGQVIDGGAAQAIKDLAATGTGGYDLMTQGIKAQAAAGVAKAAEEAAFLDKTNQEDLDRIKTQELNEIARQKHLDEKLGEMETTAKALASAQLDYGKMWENKTNGQKVAAAIAMQLSASGKGGPFWSILSGAINADITAQQAKIKSLADANETRTGFYGQMYTRFKDKRAAEEATRVAYLNNAENQLKGVAAKYAGQEVQAKADVMLGEIQLKKQEATQRFMQSILGRMPVDGDSNPELLKPEQRERFVPGYGLALTAKDATDLKNDVANAKSSKESIRRLIQISNESGKSLDPSLIAEASTIAATLRGTLRTFLVGPGAVTESEQKLLDDVIANPTKLLTLDSTNRKRLETLNNRVDSTLASKVSAFGLSSPGAKIGFQTASK